MEKIKKILLVREGNQLRDYLAKKNMTELELAIKVNKYETSIKSYLKKKIITSSVFIEQLEEIFNISYSEMVITIEQQIKNYIAQIKKDIKYYNSKEDSKVINELYELTLCKENNIDLYHQLVSKGCLALYRFNIELYNEAVDMLKEVIDIANDKGITELEVYYSVQLSYVYMFVDKKQCTRILDDIAKRFNDSISNDTLYSYHYFYGIILLQNNKLKESKNYKEARNFFEKSTGFASSQTQKTRSILAVAETFSLEKKYKKALIENRKALVVANGDVELTCNVLNNIASLHIDKGDNIEASRYLNQALEYLDNINNIKMKYYIYDTYIRVSPKDIEEIIIDVMNLLVNNPLTKENECYISKCYNTIFEKLKENNDIYNIKKILNFLLSYLNKEGKADTINELRNVIINVLLYINEKGVEII